MNSSLSAGPKHAVSEAVFILDASAALAVFFGEPGSDRVVDVVTNSKMSAVNFGEVVAKMHDRGVSEADIALNISDFDIAILPFDRDLAELAGHLRPLTRHLGLSLGDRACLATAQSLGCTVLTADRAWAELDLGIAIEIIR